MKMGLSEKEAVAVVDGYIESAINHAQPLADKALQEAAKTVPTSLNLGASMKAGQKTAPLQTTKGLGVPVGEAVTTKATAHPRFQLALTPSRQGIPVGESVTTRQTVAPTPQQLALPAPTVSQNITAPSVHESDWGERSSTTGLRTTTHEVPFTTKDGISHNGILVEDGEGNLYGISNLDSSPVAKISPEEASVPPPTPEIAPKMTIPVAPEGYTILYHATPVSNLDSVIESGIRVGTSDSDGRKNVVWATVNPNDYAKGYIGLIAFKVKTSELASAYANKTDRMIRHDILPSDIVGAYKTDAVDDVGKVTFADYTPEIAPQIVPVSPPVAEEATIPTVPKMEIPATRDSLIGMMDNTWKLVSFDKDGSPLWTNPRNKVPEKHWQDARWVTERLAYNNRTPEQIAAQEAQNKEAGKIISGAFNAVTPSTEKGAVVQPKWGKWIGAVGTRRTSGVGTGKVDTIKTPVTYRLASGNETVRAYAPTRAADSGIGGPWVPETGKRLELKGDDHTYYITQKSEADAKAEGNPSYRPFNVIEAQSGSIIGYGDTVKNAIGNAQETINANKEIYADRIGRQVQAHGEVANPISITNTAPLPAGQTSNGEVDQTVTNTIMEPSATSGTSQTIAEDAGATSKISVSKEVKAHREAAEKMRKLRQESKEKMKENGKKLMEKAKKAAEGQ